MSRVPDRTAKPAIFVVTALVYCGVCWMGCLGQSAPNAFHSDASATEAPSHSVKLSWNASVPASKAARDSIIGYIVYRSTKPHDPNALPINSSRVAGTTYVDSRVEAGKTYYYSTRAVSANGKLSGSSNETIAVIPPAPSH